MIPALPFRKINGKTKLFGGLYHLNDVRFPVVELCAELVLNVYGRACAVLHEEIMTLVKLGHPEIHNALDVCIVATVLDLQGGNRVLPVEDIVAPVPEGDLAVVDKERVELLYDARDLVLFSRRW